MWTPLVWVRRTNEIALQDLALKSDEILVHQRVGQLLAGLQARRAIVAVTDQRLICVPLRMYGNTPFQPVDIWFPEIKAVDVGFDWPRFTQYIWVETTNGTRVKIGLWRLQRVRDALLSAIGASVGGESR